MELRSRRVLSYTTETQPSNQSSAKTTTTSSTSETLKPRKAEVKQKAPRAPKSKRKISKDESLLLPEEPSQEEVFDEKITVDLKDNDKIKVLKRSRREVLREHDEIPGEPPGEPPTAKTAIVANESRIKNKRQKKSQKNPEPTLESSSTINSNLKKKLPALRKSLHVSKSERRLEKEVIYSEEKTDGLIPFFIPRKTPVPTKPARDLSCLVHFGVQKNNEASCELRYLTSQEALPYIPTASSSSTFLLPESWGHPKPINLSAGQAFKGSGILLNTGINVLSMEYSPCGHFLAVGGSFLGQKVFISSTASICSPNGLQIWRLKGDTVEIAITLCHDFGAITSLSWLPCSAAPKKSPFIGIIAFAATSGKVYLVHVPRPTISNAFLNLSVGPWLLATLSISGAPLHCLKWSPQTHPACLLVGSNHGALAGYSLLKVLSRCLSGDNPPFVPRFVSQPHRGILQWVDFVIIPESTSGFGVVSSGSDGNLIYQDWENPRRTLRLYNQKIPTSPICQFMPFGAKENQYCATFFTSANMLVYFKFESFFDMECSRKSRFGIIGDSRPFSSATSPLHTLMAVGQQNGELKLLAGKTKRGVMKNALFTPLAISYDPEFPQSLTLKNWDCLIPKHSYPMKPFFSPSSATHEHFVSSKALRTLAWNPNPSFRYDLAAATANGTIFVSSFSHA